MSESTSYCKPWNAGLASETSAVCRRIGRLLTALDTEINSNIVEGKINQDITVFRSRLVDQLTAEGWTMSYSGTNRLSVRPPGDKKPFARHA